MRVGECVEECVGDCEGRELSCEGLGELGGGEGELGGGEGELGGGEGELKSEINLCTCPGGKVRVITHNRAKLWRNYT